jgi:hypothetical protein
VTNGNSFDLYLNGQLASQRTSASTGDMPTNARFVLGRPWLPEVANSEFKGKIDEVNVWTKPGTITTTAGFETWIQGHMHNYTPANAAGLLARFDFNEGSGTTVFDRTTGNKDLTLSGTPTFSDVKTVSIAARTVVTFPRSYLTPVGGWTVPAGVELADLLVVGGGGAGGTVVVGSSGGGGGGQVQEERLLTSGASHLAVKVGTGGSPTPTTALAATQNSGGDGGSSSVLTPSGTGLTSLGGGGGANSRTFGSVQGTASTAGWTGGGGSVQASNASTGSTGRGGASFKGGDTFSGTTIDHQAAGGGGGGGGPGGNASSGAAGAGGPGVSSQLSGTSTLYGGGGGGGKRNSFGSAGSGGTGGGGAGGKAGSSAGDGLSGRGGGGGGAGEGTDQIGGSGGSGIVVIAYAPTDDKVLDFPSSGTPVTLGNSGQAIPADTSFTFESWVRSTSNAGINNIFSQRINGSLGEFSFQTVDNRVVVWYRTGTSASINTGYDLPTGEWVHLAVTVTRGSTQSVIRLYVNGFLRFTSSSISNVSISSSFNIGRIYPAHGGGEYFRGQLDQIKIWNGSLSAEEITASMHSHNTVTVSAGQTLRAHWDFNESNAPGQDLTGTYPLTASSTPVLTSLVSPAQVSGKVVYEFKRTYLTAWGGWVPPTEISPNVDALAVAGGGAGGSRHGGGGGAGAIVSGSNIPLAQALTASGILAVKIGQGGLGATATTPDPGCVPNSGTSGQATTFGALVLNGGGRGESGCGGSVAESGGSSGGLANSDVGKTPLSVSASTPTYNLTPLGNSGGLGFTGGTNSWAGGGGGGAGSVGQASASASPANGGGAGGAGVVSSISGTAICFAAGGGGGAGSANSGSAGPAGSCASGATTAGAGSKDLVAAASAAANSGSGGGGSGYLGSSNEASGSGGSGVVILALTSLAKNDLAWQKTSLAQNYASASAQVSPSTGPWTVEMWIKPDLAILTSGNFHALFSQMGDSNDVVDRASLWLKDGNLHYTNGAGHNATYTGYKFTESRWFHVAMSSNDTTVKLFVDGAEVLSTTLSKGTIGPIFTVGGARQNDAGAIEFAGHMDQVKVWNGALEASQLAASMHSYSTAGVTSAPTLLAHYDFNEFVSGQVIDRSGNNRHLAFNTGVEGSYSSTNFTDSAIVTTTTTATNQIHQFNRSYLTAAGGWFPPADAPASHTRLIVGAGGGGGAGGVGDVEGGGGGGAGGRVVVVPSLTQITGPQTIRVGAGGIPGLSGGGSATAGQSSSFGTAQAFGGGAGTNAPGSGTVGAAGLAPTSSAAATGGTAGNSSIRRGGGGGGASGNGIAGSASSAAGNGGPAVISLLSGSSLSYGGGGGGGVPTGDGQTTADSSAGIGGYEAGGPVRTGANGKPNRGGGGGGGSDSGGAGGQGGTGVVIVSFNLPSAAALPTSAICDGSSTQNTLKVEAGHGEVFYIDTGQGQEIDAAYIAYKVSSPTARNDLWVEVTGFTGGSVSLANNKDSALPLGALSGNGSRTAFFMIKAKNATTTAQSHVVNVYNTKPTIGNPRPIYTCNYTFTAVEETIKAAANKVDSVTTSSVAQLGATMTITVNGDTGTIGQGNAVDGRMIWLTPAARSDWPTGALRLESTTLTLFSNSQRTNVLSTHSDTLRVNATTSPALSDTNRQYYRAIYTFRVIGPAATTAPIIPIAMISSGTQIKHTDVSGISGGTVDITKPVVNLKVTKNVSPTTIINDDGTTTFNYTVSLVNGGTEALVIDEVIDTPDHALSYKPGSAEFSGATIADPGLIGTNQLGFSGPLSLPASSTRTITYQMVGTTCAVGSTYEYSNTATARSGTVVIGSGSATQSVVDIRGNCGEAQAVVEVKDEPIPPTATTSGANSVTTTTATITGIIDPNGEPGLPVRFEFGTSPDLTGDTDFPLAPSTASSTGYGVSANLTGLTPGTTYYYRVVILDKNNVPVLGEIMSFTTDPAPAPPTAQTDQVTGITTSTATFNGAIDPNSVSGGAKVSYEWGLANVDGTCTAPAPTSISLSGFLQSETVPANPPTVAQTEDAILTGSAPTPMTFDATGLSEDTKYCVRIVGHHGANFGTRVEGDWVPFTMTAKLPQVITFNSAIESLPAGGTTTVSAFTSSDSGIEIRFESVDLSICTVDPITGAVTAVATSGVCSITATQAGNDLYYAALPKTISFEISPPVITTPQSEIPGGTYGSSLTNKQLEASGGSGTYTNWTMTSGSLPTGVTLNSSGLLSGIPGAAGIYTFTVTTQSNGITGAPVTYTITIAKVPVVITAANISVVYGSAVPSVSPLSYTGFVGSDNAGNVFPGPGPAPLNIAPTCSTDYRVGDNAGTTNRTTFCSGAWSKNYTFTYVDGTVTVTKLAIVVTALNAAKQNRVVGGAPVVTSDPSFVGQFTIQPSLPAGQTLLNAIPGGVSVSRTNTASTTFDALNVSWPAGQAPGTYAITASGVSESTNYTISYDPGVLTIQTPKGVPQLSSEPKVVDLGETNSSNALDIEVINPCSPDDTGTIVYSYHNGTTWVNITSVASLNAGLYTIRARYIPNETSNCYGRDSEVLETTYQLTIQQAIATITAGTSQKWAGDPDPELTWTITGLTGSVTEDDIGNVTLVRTSGEQPGSYNVTPSGASHPNYTFNYVQGKLYIAKILINANAEGGVLANRDVSLTCAGLKPGAAITLKISTPEQVLANATAANDGTCSVTTVIPSALLGNFRLDTESQFPTSTPIANTRLVSLVTDPPVEFDPPAEDPPTQNPPAQNPPAQNPPGNPGGGGLPGPGSLNPAPRPTPSPTPTRGNIPSIPTPGGFVVPRPPSPTPSPTPSDQNIAKGPTQADPLATPPLAAPPRIPGVTRVIPAIPNDGGNTPSQEQRPATVDTGAGVRPLQEVATSDSGLASSSRQSGVRTVDELANEKLGGFAPSAGLRIEILGAKTGARFVLADLQAIDAVALIRAMEASITTQAADFSRITRVVRTDRPLIQRAWEPEVREGIDEFFAAVGLDAPRALIDLDLTGVRNWVSVQAEVETYQPGSTVFLVATSSPIVLATAEVDQNGRAQLAGAMPVEALGSGEHRVRIVGIRSLDGVSVDDQGEIQLSEALLAEIQRFDLGTQSTIALSGLNPEGGYHSAIRVVPLVPVAPWWTLWFILAGLVLALGARYRRLLDTPTRRVIAASGVVASALPAVIIGWVSTVTGVVWVGILLGLVGAVASWFMPEKKQAARSR